MKLNALTVKTLEDQNLFVTDGQEDRSLICERWMFPLWPLDLRIKDIEKADLLQIREDRLRGLGYS